MNYYARAKRVTASLPRDLALAIMEEIQEARGTIWIERVRGPKACMVIHQIMMERAHTWLWHEKPGEKQPTTAAQPPPATKFHRQPDFTPRAVGTWAAENIGGRMLCQTYQQNQCAGTPALWEPMFVPWWLVITATFAAQSIQPASIGGTRRQPSREQEDRQERLTSMGPSCWHE